MDSLTPRSLRKNSRSKDSKNPYSTRGLDKFSALLAELEEKKQKIYSQKGSEDISSVHFIYKDSNECVPIVVKAKKDKKQDKTKSATNETPAEEHVSETLDKFPVDHSASEKDEVKLSGKQSDNKTGEKVIRSFSLNNIKLNNLRRPSYYLPAAIILILLFLVFFGRSFAILCTSIGWYIVPTLREDSSSNETRQINKKKYERRMSEIKMVKNELSSPTSGNNCATVKRQLRGQTGHRKSW